MKGEPSTRRAIRSTAASERKRRMVERKIERKVERKAR
jgi:hypothetical protein